MKKRGTYYVSTFTVDESVRARRSSGDARRSLSRRRALAESLQQFAVLNIADKVKSDRTCRSSAALANGMRNLKTLTRRRRADRLRNGLGANPARIPLGRAPGVGADGGGRLKPMDVLVRRDTRGRRDARSDRSGNARAGKAGRLPGAVGQPPGRRPEHRRLVSSGMAVERSSRGHLGDARDAKRRSTSSRTDRSVRAAAVTPVLAYFLHPHVPGCVTRPSVVVCRPLRTRWPSPGPASHVPLPRCASRLGCKLSNSPRSAQRPTLGFVPPSRESASQSLWDFAASS